MTRDDLSGLLAFVAVAEARSFTRAGSQLGMSASALSHAMRGLEERLGLRLLARTTRSVATTEIGEKLLQTLRPAFAEIEAELASLNRLRDRPVGTVRITTSKHAASSVLWPVLPDLLRTHPDIRVELTVDETLTDIVAGRFDAGVRFGEKVARDMIAVRIGTVVRSAVVGSPAYFADHPPPATPQDLAGHRCISYRLGTAGMIFPWEFEADGRSFEVRVEGSLVFNDGDLVLEAALAGQGIAYLIEDQVAAHVAAGRLTQILPEWCWTAPGYYLYYPSRRQMTPALAAVVAALRAASDPGPG